MSNVDLVLQLAGQLEQDILSGRLAPGDLLPSERELKAQMGVSRSVVREALHRLASLGLVQSVHGSGTRVAPPTSRQITVGYQRLITLAEWRVEHLAAVRLPLETAIAALAASHRSDEHLERLARTQKVLANARRTLEAHVKADVEFHAVLAEASGNPLFPIVLAPLQELLIESRRRTLGRWGAEIAFRHHGRILAAVEAGDAAAAAQAMREHLEANLEHAEELGRGPP
jgi:GntR family transcriptional repressor for pyruvate dehydrogenase complex